MIVQLRIDDRLIHGQVATVWSKFLDIDSIVVANDYSAKDELSRQILLATGKSTGKRIVIKSVDDVITLLSDPRADKRKVLLICDSPSDALKLVSALKINEVNVANFIKKAGSDKVYIGKYIKCNKEEYLDFVKLAETVPNIYSKLIPTDFSDNFKGLLEKAKSNFD